MYSVFFIDQVGGVVIWIVQVCNYEVYVCIFHHVSHQKCSWCIYVYNNNNNSMRLTCHGQAKLLESEVYGQSLGQGMGEFVTEWWESWKEECFELSLEWVTEGVFRPIPCE